MKNTAIKMNAKNVETVAKELKGLIPNHTSDNLKLEAWISGKLEDLKEHRDTQVNIEQKLRAIEYIKEHQELMLHMVENGPTYVQFSAETNIECLLEYGSELIQPYHFARSYDAALRKLQETFKNRGYEFSKVIFTSVDDGGIALIWETNKPVSFQDVLDYPQSLMSLASLLDELNIFGLDFGNWYHLIGPFSTETLENCLIGQVFKEGCFNSYGDSDCHLVQECPFDCGGFIHYRLNDSYHLELDENINEEFLKIVVQSGYHLEGNTLRSVLNGIIESVEIIKW
ncbi:MAG: hypothetical protein J6D33_10725 [Turicibacter sp.]|nr:hypothetical protein [Turicibacter sp.]